jgi:transcriptional regulator with XRE-family HTH domain
VPRKPKLKCDIGASFAIAFKNWRQKSNLPLKQVAADLGLSIGTVSKWELGKRFPSKRHFAMLAEYTGLPPCKLFCVMADKCMPAECLLAMSQLKLTR